MAAAKKDSRPLVIRLTPLGVGAVAVVRVEGPRATEIVSACFSPRSGWRLEDLPIGRIVLGRWGGPEGEELIVCRREADAIEVHPHGGRAAIDRVVRDLTDVGAIEISWKEWVRQSETCPIRAEAQIALADAPTQRTAAILLDQFHGALRRDLERAVTHLSVDEVQQAADVLAALAGRSELGRHLVHPWRIVLAGPPNVGKSSLINALVGYERAVVYDEPGTTRDVVTARTAIDGWPVELFDTAGLGASSEPLEAEGVQLAERAVQLADVVIVVVDATSDIQGLNVSAAMPADAARRFLVAINKIDLVDQPRRAMLLSQTVAPHRRACLTSAITREGIDGLLAAVAQALVSNPPPPGAGVPFLPRHHGAIDEALAAIAAGNVSLALGALQAVLSSLVWTNS